MTGPTITAVLDDGPLKGSEVEAAVVEGRPRGGGGRVLGRTPPAVLDDAPLKGGGAEPAGVGGRPPKTIDLDAADGTTCRYVLSGWVQSGQSARYEFLYTV